MMAEDPATKPIQQTKLMEQKGREGSDDAPTEWALPSELIEQEGGKGSDKPPAEWARPSEISKTADQESSGCGSTDSEISKTADQDSSGYGSTDSEMSKPPDRRAGFQGLGRSLFLKKTTGARKFVQRRPKGLLTHTSREDRLKLIPEMLERVLLHTRRLIVTDSRRPVHMRKGKKSWLDTVLREDSELELPVVDWKSTDDETHLELLDVDYFSDLISILAPLCPAVEHISIDCPDIRIYLLTHKPMSMRSVITVCIKSLSCIETLQETLLAVSNFFPAAESLDLQVGHLFFMSIQAYSHEVNSLSSVRELKLRYSDDLPTDNPFMDVSTSCPNIVSLVLSGFGRWLSNTSGKDIASCKMVYLTNIQLEPVETEYCCLYETFTNVLHAVHVVRVASPHLKLVEAKKVQLGGAKIASVKWSRTSCCELQLEGASALVPMADLMHLVSNELEGVTVLTFDRCMVDFPQSISHPPQSTGEESSLQELKFLNVENPLSQTDIHILSEMYPNVKVTVEHESQASHEDSEHGTGMPFKPERKNSPFSPPSQTSIDEVIVKPIKMECCRRVGVEGGKLQLDSFGIELEIPPGAIDREAPQEISLRVLTNSPNLGNSKEEMSVCFGVQCLAPDDLVLKLPVTYTIPHCAVITRYSSLEAVLYTGEGEYSPDAEIKDQIPLTQSGIPNFNIERDILRLQMNHFSWAFIRFKLNVFFRGKRMHCLPFAEKQLPKERTPVVLRAHLYDGMKGSKEIASQEEGIGFAYIHPEAEVLIRVAEVDVEMTCFIKRDPIGDAVHTVKYDELRIGHQWTKSFNLDLRSQPDEKIVVTLQVGQTGQSLVELLCIFNFAMNRSGKQEDFDKKLTTVARKIATRVDIDNLMKALCLQPGDVQHYVNDNTHSSYMVTLSMLRDWRKKQTKAKECEALKDVLEEAGQTNLADELFGTS